MKRISIIVAVLAVALCTGFVLSQETEADVIQPTEQVAPQQVDAAPDTVAETPAGPAKKCSFNSDCPHGKCSKGQCGACGFDSECKGWGKCSKGQCGACGFDSECKGFGKCSGGKCTKSPY